MHVHFFFIPVNTSKSLRMLHIRLLSLHLHFSLQVVLMLICYLIIHLEVPMCVSLFRERVYWAALFSLFCFCINPLILTIKIIWVFFKEGFSMETSTSKKEKSWVLNAKYRKFVLDTLQKSRVLVPCVLLPLRGMQANLPQKSWIIHNGPEIYFGTTQFFIKQQQCFRIKIEAYKEE